MEPVEEIDEREARRLVDACRQGDRAAQYALYRQYASRVHTLVSRIAGPEEADDVTQNTFVQAFRALDQFRGESRFQTWLYRLAINEATRQRRRGRRWSATRLPEQPVAASADRAKQRDDRELLERALQDLPEDLRTVFLLREVEGFSYHDLAEACDLPEGTVASKLNRARQQLRQRLRALGWEG